MAHPIVHFEIAGKDGDKTTAFYQDLFDWEIEHMAGADYHMVKAPDGRGIAGGMYGAREGSPPYVTVYVEVADAAAALAKAESMCGKIITQPMQVPNGPTIAMFADPSGLTIGLVQADGG